MLSFRGADSQIMSVPSSLSLIFRSSACSFITKDDQLDCFVFFIDKQCIVNVRLRKLTATNSHTHDIQTLYCTWRSTRTLYYTHTHTHTSEHTHRCTHTHGILQHYSTLQWAAPIIKAVTPITVSGKQRKADYSWLLSCSFFKRNQYITHILKTMASNRKQNKLKLNKSRKTLFSACVFSQTVLVIWSNTVNDLTHEEHNTSAICG